MKTTVDISDVLFFETKALAEKHSVTFRTLIERGLTKVINESQIDKPKKFKLRKCSVGGGGMSDEFIARGGFANLREIANERW